MTAPRSGDEPADLGQDRLDRQKRGTSSARRGGQHRSERSTGYRAHSHYTPAALELRARNAWYWTQLQEHGFNTKSELVVAGMTLMCEMLEELFNDGHPFPDAPDDVRRGPSPAGAARQSAAMRAWWAGREQEQPHDQSRQFPRPAEDVEAD